MNKGSLTNPDWKDAPRDTKKIIRLELIQDKNFRKYSINWYAEGTSGVLEPWHSEKFETEPEWEMGKMHETFKKIGEEFLEGK